MAYSVCFQLLMIITIKTIAQQLSCDPGEEFTPSNLIYNGTDLGKNYNWKKMDYQLAYCLSKQPDCTVSDKSGNYTASVSGQTLVLTIVNVTRDSAGNYSCYDAAPFGSGHNCDFIMYAKPNSVLCQQPQLQEDSVRVVCTVNKSYPSPLCQFSWIRNDIEMNVTQTITYQNISVQGQPAYFYRNCSLTLPVQSLGLGSHEFRVTAYPDVTHHTSDIKYGRQSNKTTPVIINNATARLESCPDSYVQEGTMISCTCNETSNTFLLANTSLKTGSGTLSSGVGLTTYNFNFTRNLGEIICQAELLNWTRDYVKYTPKIAYGPDRVSLKVMYNNMDINSIDLCDYTQPVELTANCSVSNNSVSPAAVFHFYINETHMSEKPSNLSTLTYRVSKAGPLLVQCTGNNSEFSNVSASQEVIIQVKAPPTGPPIIEKYQDSSMSFTTASNLLTVQEGMSMIRCRVEGGYPSVSSLFLNCGSMKNMSSENMVTLGINVSRSKDSSDCSCTAAHNSSCYKSNSTILKLDVQFEPTIISFNVTEHTANVTVQRDSSVVFYCEAEGNPSPVLSLRKEDVQLGQLGSYSSSTQKFNLLLKVNKTMTDCKDTGVYVCQAKTDQTVKNKSVDVYVKCMQQFDKSVKQNMVYVTRGNSSLNISIPVYGYPEPTLHLRGETHDLDLETYNLTYINQGPPYGIVSLSISTTSVTVFQNYNLNITNTEGSQLYYFQIKYWDSTEDPVLNVGAIVGGIVVGLLVIVAIALIVFFLKRKGIIGKGSKDAPRYMLSESNETVNHSGANGHHDASRNMSGESVIDNSPLYYMQNRDEVVIDNSPLYYRQNTDEVLFDNSDIYNKTSDEVVVDNSDLYNMQKNSDEVIFDNSEIYNMHHSDPGNVRQNSEYRLYSEITPTITSATTVPVNMRTIKEQDNNNPYEDVERSDMSSGSNVKTKPSTAMKPKPPEKPKPAEKPKPRKLNSAPQKDKQNLQKKGSHVDQTYSQVVKVPKSDKPFVVIQKEEDFFLDPSQQPEVPEKKYEKADKDIVNEKKKFKESAVEDAAAPTDLNFFAYANNGFSDTEDDLNVYNNTTA